MEPSWKEAVETIAPYVIKISTPDHAGTACLFAFGAAGGICGFATAAHALAHAHQWEQPIRIEHCCSGYQRLLRPTDRAIVIDDDTDTAALVFLRDDAPFPKKLLQLTPENAKVRVGVEIGWVGYPAVAAARDTLCFFSGRVSAWLGDKRAYLVDGVAVSGVSGGPAFRLGVRARPEILGVVSAYLPNKAAGTPLPGLSLVQHIGELENVVRDLRNLAQAPPSLGSDERGASDESS